MAAVYSVEECSLLQTDIEISCCEKQEDVAQTPRTGSGTSDKALMAESAAAQLGLRAGGPALEARQHEEEEAAAVNAAVPLIQIKEEETEENEYITVSLNVAGEDSDEQTDGNASLLAVDDSADGDWPFRCEDCSEAFESKEAYLEHRREHTHDGPIVCLDTDSQWDDLLVSTDGGRRTLCCALCGRIFSSSRGFFTHQLKHRSQDVKQQLISDTGQSPEKQKLFECKDCGKMFTSVGQCLNHQRSHKQASKSVFHELDHLKKKSFPCPTCGRCYSRASALDAHRRCHEVKLVKPRSGETERVPSDNEVPVKIEQTDVAITEQIDESEKKLFECVCGRSFRTMCGLGTHQRFSSTCSDTRVKVEAKRSFDCSECGKAFVSSLALSCHQHWHKRRARLHGSGQKFKCMECGRVFTSLTFYNKHQRLAHSKEMPAKSFLNQVVHLQKKAFECQECGLRFSRASALHSHELCHTEEFSDIIKSSKTHPVDQTSSLYQNEPVEADRTVGAMDHSQDALEVADLDKEFTCDTSGDTEDHEVTNNGFEIISITESDDSESGSQTSQDPDLELVCESDQEEKEDFSFSLSQEAEVVSSQPIHPEMNVKIVQIDYEHFKGGLVHAGQEMDMSPPQDAKKYDCPDCGRTFMKAVALRCHMLWHRGGMGKKSRLRRNVGVTPIRRVKCEICGHESFSKAAHYFHLGKHEDRKPYKSITYQLANLQKNSFKCEICGMQFSRLSALHSHQQHHDTKKPYACSQCDKSYANPSGLYNHRKICWGKDGQERKAEHFNPTKTLLGPKVHHCKKCGKGFWSIGAFIHHKQYQQQCADVSMSSSEASHQSEGGRVRRKRRGRKRGIVNRKTGEESKEEHKCEVCGKSYRMLACFLKHQLIHDVSGTPPPAKSFDYQVEQLKKNSYSCPDCGKLFSRAMALQFHMKSHGYETGFPSEKAKLPHTSGDFQCQTCFVFFDCISALQIHQQRCVKPKTESEEQMEESQKDESGKLNVAPKTAHNQMQTSETEKNLHSENLLKIHPADLKYKCDDCGRGFSVAGALNIHRSMHCKGRLFKSKSQWQVPFHENFKEQSAKFPFICSECGRSFSTNAALGTHKRWHKDKRVARLFLKSNTVSRKNNRGGNFSCNLCGKQFFYLCVLRRHQKYHPRVQAQPDAKLKSSFACPDCEEFFSSESLLAAHLACHHAGPSDVAADAEKLELEAPVSVQMSGQPIQPLSSSPISFKMIQTKGDKIKVKYQCNHCQKSFLNIRGVRAHKWQKHRRVRGRPPGDTYRGTKPLACSGCERRYSSHGALYNHERSCSAVNVDQKQPVRSVKANVVEGSSLAQRSLESTMKCLFKCHKCGKAFPSEAQLDAHKEAARTRPHSCALCCRGYWTENQLQQHLAWHDEVRKRLPTELRYRLNASSSSCPVNQAQTSACPSNVNSVSLAKLPTTTDSQSCQNHRCHQCGEAFLSKHALEQHQTLHKKQEPYHCSLCPQTFGEIRDLIDHHQECLGDKELRDSSLSAPSRDDESLTCIECGTSFDQETDLHQHYIEHARGVV
ncbi:zinc finger protein 91 isoform X1 [Pygocentrus nattereri]|uniref:C2H2-type domain-containing protein n=1 Tax=Pygocentrus nattereri TaxID=42514 RepID=A0A3B4EEZ0_PYGNA|nr:zinc finger protein 91 isoform X1 [Pygocentrus nattereri]